MLGLLIKDIRLIRNQGLTTLLFSAVMGFIMLISLENSALFVSYLTMLSAFLVLNSVSYDSYENGYAFLFTLPVSPRLYVVEKYVLALLFSSVGCLASGCVAEAFSAGNYKLWEHWFTYLAVWTVMLWMFSLMLPLHLKFGAEKSRLVLIALWAGVFAIAYLVSASGATQWQGTLTEGVASLYERMGVVGICLAGGIGTLAVFLLSLGISIRIMRKKEF